MPRDRWTDTGEPDPRGRGIALDGASEEEDDGDEVVVRPFWSGTITFGLVSIPVNLYPGNRSTRAGLRMLDGDGTPLVRRYYCPVEEREVTRDEIVRGYELDGGEFVIIDDDELEALAPERTRDIDLQRFVDAEAIDARYFRRSYFLAPARESAKAYRLLADTMERTGRAGVATFVMRGKEYLVAILAENGILQAETLRFPAELRPVDEIELPEKPRLGRDAVARFEEAIRGRVRKTVDMTELEDHASERIRKLVERKKRRREDIVKALDEAVEPAAQVIDLMEVLKQRLQGRGLEAENEDRRSARPRRGQSGRRGRRGQAAPEDLQSLSKQELYERAKTLDIPGRSGMNKDELISAIRGAAA